MPVDEPAVVGGAPLTTDAIAAVAAGRRGVALDPAAPGAMARSVAWVEQVVAGPGAPEPIYGINTGFGSLAGREAFPRREDAVELSRRLVLSNAAGVGRHLDPDVVRAATLIRAQGLARGYSGVRPVVVDTLLAMLEAGVEPAIPEYGSLGASGDLMPLAHLALVVTQPDEARETTGGRRARPSSTAGSCPAAEAMEAAGLERLVLGPKEALGVPQRHVLLDRALRAGHRRRASASWRRSEVALAMTAAGAARLLRRASSPTCTRRAGRTARSRRPRTCGAARGLDVGRRRARPRPGAPAPAGRVLDSLRAAGPRRRARRRSASSAAIVDDRANAVTDNPVICIDLPPRDAEGRVRRRTSTPRRGLRAPTSSPSRSPTSASLAERRIFRLDDGTLNRGLPEMLIASEQRGHGLRPDAAAVPRRRARVRLQHARAPRQRRLDPDVRRTRRTTCRWR